MSTERMNEALYEAVNHLYEAGRLIKEYDERSSMELFKLSEHLLNVIPLDTLETGLVSKDRMENILKEIMNCES